APGALANDPDTAAHFDGSDAYVAMGDLFDFTAMAPFSFEVWATIEAPAGGITGKSFTDANGYEGPMLALTTTGELRFSRGPNDQLLVPTPPAGVFVYLVATFDGQLMALYVDGVQVGTLTATELVADNATRLVAGHVIT